MPTFQQTVLLGTERMSAPPPAPHPALAPAWDLLDWASDCERALLEGLVLMGGARTAAQLPGQGSVLPMAAAEENKAQAPATAAALLPQLLSGDFRPLLGEWLSLCAGCGLVLPPLVLPRVFAATTRAEKPALAAVLGERGRWLLRQNPAWHGLLEGDSVPNEKDWDEGSPAERLAWLRARRRKAPEEARLAVQRSWDSESADFREEVLALFAENLGTADEAFLVACLRDRRKGVRQCAQRLLASMSGSALATRLRERASHLVSYQKGFLSKKLELELPAAFDPAWKADALEEKAPTGIGEKAFWVQQILACTPFQELRTRTQLDTEALCSLAAKGEWSNLLLHSWFLSLDLFPDAELAAELLQRILSGALPPPQGLQKSTVLDKLLPLCPVATRWRLVLEHGGEGLLVWQCLPLLGEAPEKNQPAKLLALLAPAIRQGTVPGGAPQAVLAARHLPVSLREEAARRVHRDEGLTRTADCFLRALDLRASLHTLFSVSKDPLHP